ncbi:putative peptidase A22B, signal peptide peptidase [Helianthus debilis subsp. tardiflorus]
MVCEADEPDVNISFPVAMLPQDASESLKQSLQEKINVSVRLYSPKRPLVDVAEVFLWHMAIGSILFAS